MKDYFYAEVAYEAYRTFSEGKSLVSGSPIPEFAKLPLAIQDAWYEAALAVREACGGK